MEIPGELFAVFVLWLGLMTVLGVFAARIATLLHTQRRAERYLRWWMAVTMGRAARESRRSPGEPA